jgi:hypothetical protein
VVTVVAGLYIQHAIDYLNVRSQADEQLAVVHRLEGENATLRREQQSLNDPSTIVRDARALGMIQPSERPYVVINH